jgi:hypothetical protein
VSQACEPDKDEDTLSQAWRAGQKVKIQGRRLASRTKIEGLVLFALGHESLTPTHGTQRIRQLRVANVLEKLLGCKFARGQRSEEAL